jgi:hypothetical protein
MSENTTEQKPKFNRGQKVILETIEGDKKCKVKAFTKNKFGDGFVYLLEDLTTLEDVVFLNKRWLEEKLLDNGEE